MCYGETAGRCGSEQSIFGKALKGHVFATVETKSLDECFTKCQQEPRCQSFNYVINENIFPLGSIPALPAQSCKEIKANEGGQAVSSNSWLDPSGSGEVILAYCDMNTEARGGLELIVKSSYQLSLTLRRFSMTLGTLPTPMTLLNFSTQSSTATAPIHGRDVTTRCQTAGRRQHFTASVTTKDPHWLLFVLIITYLVGLQASRGGAYVALGPDEKDANVYFSALKKSSELKFVLRARFQIMSVDGEHNEALDEKEERIENLKQEKAKDKSAFTRVKNKLLYLLDEEDYASRREVKQVCQKLCEVQERAMDTMEKLSQEYLRTKEKEKRKKDELSSLATDASENTRRRRIEESVQRKSVEKQTQEDQLKREQDIARSKEDLEELNRQYRSRLLEEEQLRDLKESPERFELGGLKTTKFREEKSTDNRSSTPSLGQDMWKQLTRVSIAVFNGDKKLYEGWKTAFMACVDKAPATPEYKLLQLRQYLSGEALKVVEPLGHSAAAYEAAKKRLERKFGGKRRQIALNLEELENFKPLRPGYAKDLERLADLLDVTVVNLREAGRFTSVCVRN
ncbi:hypothetical protein ACROYT_G003911 [Oculina patagonica]